MHRSPGKLNVRHSPYALSKTLKEFGVFESQADLEKREKVLEDLNQIVKHWICSTSVAQVFISFIYYSSFWNHSIFNLSY